MPIVLVVNGFFRSGSTLVWNVIKKSNPKMINLYEPFHPALFKELIVKEKGHVNPLHNLPIWDDYFNLDKKVIRKMRKSHKFWHIVLNLGHAEHYLDTINSLNERIFIQPNRASLILKQLHVRYKPKIIHLIRNPLDTLISFGLYGKNKGNRLKLTRARDLLLKFISDFSKIKNLSDIYLLYYYLVWHLSNFKISNYHYKETYKLLKKSGMLLGNGKERDNIDKFLLVWTTCNYLAKKQVEEIRKYGMILHYENLVANPKKELKKVSKFIGVKIKLDKITIHKKGVRVLSKNLKKSVEKKLKNLRIKKEVKYILGGKIYKQTFG